MTFMMPIFSVALPEIFMLCMVSIVLLVDIFLKEHWRIVTYVLVQLTLLGTFILVYQQYHEYPAPIVTFSGHYVLDKLAVLTKLFVLVASFFAFIYARQYIKERHIARGEYYLLGLFAVLGMMIMASAYSFLTIYLGLELLSLSLYAMVALYKESVPASEAAMKYFVMGALASGLLLYGISMLYGVTGSIQVKEIGALLNGHVSSQVEGFAQGQSIVVMLGMIFILAGLLFKFGAVPFHMWVPDVYTGAPTSMTLFIASAPKIAAFCITMRVLVEALPSMNIAWENILTVVSVLSMFGGNVLAIAQTNIKRMLAYSSIAHIGYSLLGILAGPHSENGYSAAMFYISTYVIVAAGAFAVIALLSKEGIELDQLEDYRGLNARNPWLAFMMLLLMFSMAGVPPTVGFFAKLGLLEALVEAHYVWLASFALVFSIIGAYYYLRVVMLMYFEEPRGDQLHTGRFAIAPGIMAAISINGIAALGLGLLPSALIDICRISV
ncbi:MAG: NADH-quinone oxidoreductase subunit NuoN [Gammaproteobacteria bacterium]|nr:NADH-quinone oxidoreductase subunit NuoN [Gammaproteobacteria bacterium]